MEHFHRLLILAPAALALFSLQGMNSLNINDRSAAAQKASISVNENPALPKEDDNKHPSPRMHHRADTGKWVFPCDENSIREYTAYRVSAAPTIDGKLDEEVWQKIPRSPRFVDLISGEETLYDTYAAVCWDDENLYIAFWLEEPFLQGSLKNYNDPVYQENDAEVFIAGEDAYYEFEINALGTRYEAFFMWQEAYEKNGFSNNPAFKLSNPLVKEFNGVGLKNQPRGLRYGSWDFKFPGLQTAVWMDGTINNHKDRDRKWTVELAFPWKGMEWLAKADQRALPPKDNDVWRIDFTRFNPYKEAAPAKDSGGWAWSPHGVWDSHVPECFPKITFSREERGRCRVPGIRYRVLGPRYQVPGVRL